MNLRDFGGIRVLACVDYYCASTYGDTFYSAPPLILASDRFQIRGKSEG